MERSKVEDSDDCSIQLHPDSRNSVVNLIWNTLTRVLGIYCTEGISDLYKFAKRLEEEEYSNSHTQSDYVHCISLKLMRLQSKNIQESARVVSLPYYSVDRDLRLDVHLCQTSEPSQLQADYRIEILCKMWDMLKMCRNSLGPLEDALKMVSSFEEEIYSSSTSQILALEENSETSCSISDENTST